MKNQYEKSLGRVEPLTFMVSSREDMVLGLLTGCACVLAIMLAFLPVSVAT